MPAGFWEFRSSGAGEWGKSREASFPVFSWFSSLFGDGQKLRIFSSQISDFLLFSPPHFCVCLGFFFLGRFSFPFSLIKESMNILDPLALFTNIPSITS